MGAERNENGYPAASVVALWQMGGRGQGSPGFQAGEQLHSQCPAPPLTLPPAPLNLRLEGRLLLLGRLVQPIPVHSIGFDGTGWDLKGGGGFRR